MPCNLLTRLRLRSALVAAALVAPVSLIDSADAQSIPFTELGRVTWREDLGGNQNDYVLIGGIDDNGNPAQMPFLDALDVATSLGGWLLTVQSQAENDFVAESLRDLRPGGGGDFWLGFSDSEDFGGFESVASDPGGPAGWVWVNGEDVSYTNWSGGEPNNAVNGDGFEEDYAELWDLNGDKDWNDIFTDGASSTNWGVVELPFTPPPLTLQIDPHSGFARALATVEEAQTTTMTSYTISSPDVAMDNTVWEQTNLAARGADAQDPGSPGESWEVVYSGSDSLFEAYLLGGTSLEQGEAVNLGKIVPAGTTDAEIAFSFSADLDFPDPDAQSQNGRQFFNAAVEYVSPIDGDYNWDGRVDAADYSVLRNAFGSTDLLFADGDRNGVVDAGDLAVWRANYGRVEPASGAALQAVPEPASVLAAFAALGGVALLRRGARR